MSIEFAVTNTGPGRSRTGILTTPHGHIQTPEFIPVATKATLKTLLPESLQQIGAQAVLANAYHLYLQPGVDIVAEHGGLGKFMNWPGPTFTDSGGFQVLSLGVGFKKVLSMDSKTAAVDDVVAPGKDRLAHVDEDGVTFRSHIDGTEHRFTPAHSMKVQQQIGADIIFAFDECTTLVNTRGYQAESVARTTKWADRCLAAFEENEQYESQGLFGVVQGAQFHDLRLESAHAMAARPFAGFGIGGALDKERLGEIVGWVTGELPPEKPRHLLGIGEPDDLFTAVLQGVDTFDCVAPSRVARNGSIYAPTGRYNILTAASRNSLAPLVEGCACPACANYSRSYLHHLFKSKEVLGLTLATLHNEFFILDLMRQIRAAVAAGDLLELQAEFLGRYQSRRAGAGS